MAITFPDSPSPQRSAATARRLVNMGLNLPDHIVEEGKEWYPAVHEATGKFVGQETAEGHKITNIHQAAGVVAAVSPSMNFEDRNIHALTELQGMGREHWDVVRGSAQGRKRSPEASAMLKEVAPSMATQTDSQLLKAHRILKGEQWHEVIPLQGSPKTHHFTSNIAEPGRDTGVTVDGRHHDIVANNMQGWEQNRGISSAGLKSGKRSRYEAIEGITRAATTRASAEDKRFAGIQPHDMQAVLWVGGKWIERGGDATRKQGPTRVGQPYTSGSGHPLASQQFWTGNP